MVARGHDPTGRKPEEPGALKVFDYRAGRLLDESSVAPNGGYGFGPRHLDFHPTQPWVYVHIDPSGRLLVASHIMGLPLRDGSVVPACLSLFRTGDDGRLDFVRKYDVEVGQRQMFWMGMVPL